MANSKKHNRKGLYGTLLFHGLLMLSFMFMGLTYTIPPPPEEGITINFGFDDFGNGDIQPEEVVEELQESVESLEEVNTPEVIETNTQTSVDAPAIKAEEKPKIRDYYTGKQPNVINSEGETIVNGDKGSKDGDPNITANSGGGIDTSGIAFNLNGRTVAILKKPIYKSQIQGTVVVTIRVNRYGKVINASPGAKGSTTTNGYLYAKAKEAALQTTFDANLDGPAEQIGTISYDFILE